jgi:hypothetical protein
MRRPDQGGTGMMDGCPTQPLTPPLRVGVLSLRTPGLHLVEVGPAAPTSIRSVSRLGIFLLTLGQKQMQINPHSRWEALHGAGASAPYTRTNGTPASPSPQPLLLPGRDRKPDARRAGAPTPPHFSSSRQLLPQPSTPPQGLPPSLTVWPTQPGMLSALLRPFTPASAEATGTSIVASIRIRLEPYPPLQQRQTC